MEVKQIAAQLLHRRLLSALAVALVVTFSSTQVLADDNQAARATFERGVEASRAEHWDDARHEFEQSLALVPKASTMFNLALAYLKLGRGRAALEQLDAFERAASPGEHAAMLERARVLRPQAQALVDSEQATAKSGGNVLSRTEDGLSDEARKDVAEARDAYAKGRDKQALEAFERAYRRSKRPELLYNIGVVADRLRNDRRAIDAYDAFVAALPDAREAAVAQVRSESLRVALERERTDDRASARSPVTDAPPAVAPQPVSLRGPRTLLVAGIVLTAVSAATLGAGASAMARFLPGWNRCLATVNTSSMPCSNPEDVRASKRLAIAGTAVSAVIFATGAVLTAVGATQLYRRKREARAVDVALLPAISLASERVGSLALVGQF